MTVPLPTPMAPTLLQRWELGWRFLCPGCGGTSRMLPFPNPDAALHGLALHRSVTCPGGGAPA